MAPATNLGAASPVQIGAPGITPQQPASEKEKKRRDELVDVRTVQVRRPVRGKVAVAEIIDNDDKDVGLLILGRCLRYQ